MGDGARFEHADQKSRVSISVKMRDVKNFCAKTSRCSLWKFGSSPLWCHWLCPWLSLQRTSLASALPKRWLMRAVSKTNARRYLKQQQERSQVLSDQQQLPVQLIKSGMHRKRRSTLL